MPAASATTTGDTGRTTEPEGMTSIATLGHGNRSAEDFLALARSAAVAHVVDVRSYPRSRRFPWFARERLETALQEAGIGYRWMGRELGGKRRAQPGDDVRHPRLPGAMAAFARHMATPAFVRACDDLMALATADAPVALMCAERDPERCHRWLIADHLELVRGVAVVHWRGPGDARRHAASDSARVVQPGELRYDRGGTAPLWPQS